LGFNLTPHWPKMTPDLKRLMIIAGPAVLSGGVVQINLLVGRQVASFTEGAVAWLSYADRLYQLPLGVVAIAIGTVLLPALSRHLRDKDEISARATFSRGMEFALFLTLPAAFALVIIADPLVSVLYGRGAWSADDTYGTAVALAAYGIGLPAFVLHKVLQPLYYAREDSRSPFKFALISMVVNVVFAVALQPVIGFLAAALATTVSGWVMVIQLWLGARKMGAAAHPDARFWARLWRIVLASAVMGVALWAMQHWLGDSLRTAGTRYGALAALCGVGIVVYFMTAGLIGAFGLGEFKGMLRRKRG
jgi:putative peptidoglycan lipid II flippase